jgi:hypothetical protein
MDFTNLANMLLKAGATTLGGALGGPAGAAAGALIVNTLGPMLGLGADATPDEIAAGIEHNPSAPSIIQQAEAQIGKSVAEIEAAVIDTINQTSRLELQSESRFVKFARPFNIWVIGVVTGGYGLCLIAATAAAVFGGNAAALNMLVANAGVIGIALAPSGAVAGVSAWGRTREKLEGVSVLPTLATAAATALKKAVRK